jgi:2-keto-4-pentenoate hydratase
MDEELAAAILAAAGEGRRIAPFAAERGLSLADGYRIAALVAERRMARGERPVGWKIGFTNRTIWDEYQVHAPIWGPMYATTVAPAQPGDAVAIGHLAEPRIEPEICFRVGGPLSGDMDEAALLAALDGVGHGFEIVQSLYPGWRFAAADTVAAFALHGLYRHGPFVDPRAAGIGVAELQSFRIRLSKNGEEVDVGSAAAVLDGPLNALRHFLRGLEDDPLGRRPQRGDIITTGTVTRAFPIAAGETWETMVEGLPVGGMRIVVRGE